MTRSIALRVYALAAAGCLRRLAGQVTRSVNSVEGTRDATVVTQRINGCNMDIQKDWARATELRRCRFWGFRKSPTECFFSYLACYLLLSSAPVAYASAADSVACPTVSPSTGLFSAGRMYQGSVVSIERNDPDQAISLSIYRPDSSGCEKTTFAKYSIEGGAPNVDSLFFMSLKGKPNIFAIVHWDINSRGIGTYGKYYQIYAYTMDKKGRLIENRSVVDDVAMTGMDGYQEGKESAFPYKTAGAVKSFFKCGQLKCK